MQKEFFRSILSCFRGFSGIISPVFCCFFPVFSLTPVFSFRLRAEYLTESLQRANKPPDFFRKIPRRFLNLRFTTTKPGGPLFQPCPERAGVRCPPTPQSPKPLCKGKSFRRTFASERSSIPTPARKTRPSRFQTKNPETVQASGFAGGANGRIRTCDLLITNQLLYRLSYIGISQRNKL